MIGVAAPVTRALLTLVAVLTIAPALAASPAPPQYADNRVRCALATSIVTLDTTPPPRFLLHYRGELAAFNGPLCYRFAGYNETCSKPPSPWLTPTTTLPFLAPGQVPVELLQGFRLELRAPQMFPGALRYYVTSHAKAEQADAPPASAPPTWKCPPP